MLDYTSPAMGQLFEARRAEFWTIAEISECKADALQHLDSLRRSSNTADITAKDTAPDWLPPSNPAQPVTAGVAEMT